MKNKGFKILSWVILVSAILFLIVVNVVAQVPNTTTFSLQDVVDEVNPSSDDLQDCFDESHTSLADPTYWGTKNDLYEFRNYGNIPSYKNSGGIATTTNGTGISIYYPFGPTSGNMLVVLIANDNTSAAIGTPSGFTSLGTSTTGALSVGFYYKISDGTESGSISVFGQTANWSGVMFEFSGGTKNGTTSTTSTNFTGGPVTSSNTTTNFSLGVNFCVTYANYSTSVAGTGWSKSYGYGTSAANGWYYVVASSEYSNSNTISYSWGGTGTYVGTFKGLNITN